MAFAPQPILGHVSGFNIPGGSISGWQELSPALAGITDEDILETWNRRAWFAVMSPTALLLTFTDPALGIPNTSVLISQSDAYHHFYTGGPVWINTDSFGDDVYVVYGY